MMNHAGPPRGGKVFFYLQLQRCSLFRVGFSCPTYPFFPLPRWEWFLFST